MKQLTEQEQEARQKSAYINRECVSPGDMMMLKCSRASADLAYYTLPSGDYLVSSQEPGREVKAGDVLHLDCTAATIGANGYGPFVDYTFKARETGHTIIINGPDAQALADRKIAPVVIYNRDIPTLADVLSVMQAVCQIERRRDWQRDRMTHITQNVTGMPGGGGSARGLDEAFSVLDELDREQQAECRDYVQQLRKAQKIINGITSQSMRTFVVMKYVMGCSDTEIRCELNMTRRGFDRARRSVENAKDMAAVKWQERYILAD